MFSARLAPAARSRHGGPVKILLICLMLTLVGACGHDHTCEHHSHDPMCLVCDGTEDTFSSSRFGDQNIFEVTIVSGDPAQHVVGNNTLVVLVRDSQGDPVDAATLEVEPFYPPGGHGTPIEPITTTTGTPGEYEITEVNYIHPGSWEVRFSVSAGGKSDQVVFVFCIEEAA